MDFGNLHSSLKVHATNKPNELALIYNDQQLTFKELNVRVNKLANSLNDASINKGDHVAIYMRNRIEMVEVLYALSTIGAVAVPINYMIEGGSLVQLINTSESKFVFIEDVQLESFENSLEDLELIDETKTVLIGQSDKVKSGYIDYENFLNNGSERELKLKVSSDDINVMVYSSGTTALPKGIMLTHGTVIHRLFSAITNWEIGSNDTFMIPTPMYHSSGHMFAFLTMFLGCTTVVTRKFEPENSLKVMERNKVTHSFFVPTQYTMMLELPIFDNFDLSSLKLLLSAAAPLSATRKQQIIKKFNCNLLEYFGSTEVGLVTYLRPEHVIRKAGSIGQQTPFSEVRLVDNDGNDVNINGEGEFAVRGPGLFRSYHKQPNEMNENMLPGNWFLMGDMGTVDEEGFYYLLDRKKDMIISGGVNVYPKDIEEVLYSHSAVSEVAVIGIPDEKWGEKVKAFVVLKHGERISADELVSYGNESLAKFQQIKELKFISSLPRNPAGKVLKRELRKL